MLTESSQMKTARQEMNIRDSVVQTLYIFIWYFSKNTDAYHLQNKKANVY